MINAGFVGEANVRFRLVCQKKPPKIKTNLTIFLLPTKDVKRNSYK
jgi:hypothetical protein